MLIDWFTVIAQIANFLILVWLMKRYLYQPILTAIDAREQRIAAQLSDAENKANSATRERDLFEQKNRQFDQERDRLMKAVQAAADAQNQKLLEAARQRADDLRAKRNTAIFNERKTLELGLATAIQHEVFAIARQTLSGLASVDLETQMTKTFLQHLAALDAQSRNALLAAVKIAPHCVQVRSAFDLAQPERRAIGQALNDLTGTELTIQFVVASDVGCGIELSAGGQKLAWSVADYLSALDAHINNVLDSITSEPARSAPSTRSSA